MRIGTNPVKLVYGVVGTQNTGKSTLISDVIADSESRSDQRIRFRNSVVDYRSKIKSLGLEINRNGNEWCQRVIFDTLYDNVISCASNTEQMRTILDRTPLDAFVYTLWHNLYGTKCISDCCIDEMWDRTVYSMRMLDRIVWIPLKMCDDVKVVDDKFRDTNLEYRRQIDELFGICLRLLRFNGIHNISLVYGTRENRVSAVNILEENDVLQKNHAFLPYEDVRNSVDFGGMDIKDNGAK